MNWYIDWKFVATIVLGFVFAIAFLVAFVMPDCPTEDSSMCIWNATERGNGRGYSFIALWDGLTIFIGGKH